MPSVSSYVFSSSFQWALFHEDRITVRHWNHHCVAKLIINDIIEIVIALLYSLVCLSSRGNPVTIPYCNLTKLRQDIILTVALFLSSGERKTSFQFTIHTESTWNKRMDWILAAQSEREMKDWIQAFKVSL